MFFFNISVYIPIKNNNKGSKFPVHLTGLIYLLGLLDHSGRVCDDLELFFDAPRVEMSTVLKDARRGQQRAGKPFDTGQRKPAEWENPKQVEKEERFGLL